MLVTALFFQTDGIAQSQKSFTWSSDDANNDNVVMTWNKNTPDSEMKEDIKALAEKGITIKYSNLKRNSNKEITAIKVEYSDRKGNKGSMEVSNQNPINTIQFFKQGDTIGFGQPSNSNGFDVMAFNGMDGEKFMKQFNFQGTPDFFDFPGKEGSITKDEKTTIMIQEDGKKPLLIEDGVVIKGGEDYTPEEIEKIKEKYKSGWQRGANGQSFNYSFGSDSDENNIQQQFEKMRAQMKSAEGSNQEGSDQVKEMEKTKEEMIKAKEEMIKAKEEMEKAKKELEKTKSSLKVRKA